jgi:predicted ATP-dependent endonuclease of OLD family
MKLKRIILKNFRGYIDSEIRFDENLNVLIGKNDVGKSTILEALEIFFNNDTVKIEIEDLCVSCSNKLMTIGVVFEIDPEKKYLFDVVNKTNLKKEFLLNNCGELEIHKTWDCNSDKLTATSMTAYLVSNYIDKFADKPLITLKIAELKKILDQNKHNVSNYDDIKKNTSASIRNAIYSSISEYNLINIPIPINKEDGKKLYESIKSEFPLYFLFQSDRANKDSDKEVQDPLRAITKKAISEVELELESVRKKIENKAITLGEETIEKLKEMSPEIASILKPNIKNKAWDSLFSFSFEGDEGIPMNKRGSGVRRLIILNYFRAEAERTNLEGKSIIYAIEEPETSQHPNHQIMLIEALSELAKKENKQVLITTHTPEIAKLVEEDNLILIKKEKDLPKSIEGHEKLREISNTLGMLPYFGKLVICVEGEFDISFLNNLNQIGEFKEIIDFEIENISIIPMIGSNLKNWADRHYLENSNVVEFHIYDRDANDQYEKAVEKINKRKDKSFALLTKYREMENYIHPKLIEKQFDINLSDKRIEWFKQDIPKLIKNKCGNLKEGDIKRIINGKLAKEMTVDNLKELEVYEEIKNWFIKIKEIYSMC